MKILHKHHVISEKFYISSPPRTMLISVLCDRIRLMWLVCNNSKKQATMVDISLRTKCQTNHKPNCKKEKGFYHCQTWIYLRVKTSSASGPSSYAQIACQSTCAPPPSPAERPDGGASCCCKPWIAFSRTDAMMWRATALWPGTCKRRIQYFQQEPCDGRDETDHLAVNQRSREWSFRCLNSGISRSDNSNGQLATVFGP